MKRCAFVIWKGILAGTGASTIGAIFFPFNDPEERPKVELKLVDNKSFNDIYDYDWDGRDYMYDRDKPVKKTHFIHLLRAGDYSFQRNDEEPTLTTQGRIQIQLTAKRLKATGQVFDRIISSTETRAREAVDIVRKEIKCRNVEYSDLLREGNPFDLDPLPRGYVMGQEPIENEQYEKAFYKCFYRSTPDAPAVTHTLIIGHSNVFRYFVCRVLQVPANGWFRMKLDHASITTLRCNENGTVRLYCYSDTGHLPVSIRSHRVCQQRDDLN